MKDGYTTAEKKEILTGIIDPGLDVHLLIKLCEILKIPGSPQLTRFINSLLRETLSFNRYLSPEEKQRFKELLQSRETRTRRNFTLIKS